jgi:lytic murein transglycosylase
MRARSLTFVTALLWAGLAAGHAQAAACGTDFNAWIADFKTEAAAAGVGNAALGALDGLKPDPAIIKLDRNQHYFKQSFETYKAKRVPPGKIASGAQKLRANEGFFKRLEQKYGVPGAVLVAIWGLETGFGAGSGNVPTIRSLATLANDCRRSDFFKNELINALKIIQRGDLSSASMKGGWAGELGQTQFLPSSYVKFAVDGDGDGHRDLIHSWPDALASTANYLKGYGWQAGKPWDEGTPNFGVLTGWNKAEVYRKTIAWFATQMAAFSPN